MPSELDPRFTDRRNPCGCILNGNWDTRTTRDLAFSATPSNGSAVIFGVDASGFRYAESIGTNSTNNIITFADREEYSFTDGAGQDLSWSISVWFYEDGFTQIGDKVDTILSKTTAYNSAFEYSVIAGANAATAYGGKPGVHMANTNATQFLQNYHANNFATGNWHHLVFTYSGNEATSGLNYYLDGVLVAGTKTKNASYTGMTNGTALLRIFSTGGNYFMDGKIAKLLLFKQKVLSASEVLQLYEMRANN